VTEPDAATDAEPPTAEPPDAPDGADGAEVPDGVPGVPAGAEPEFVRLRRAPRYRPFGLTGAGLGVLIGAVIALTGGGETDFSARALVGYFAATLGLIGALTGLGIAVALERRRP
jgi:hypothetical protein